MIECYVGMGGNYKETLSAMQRVVAELKSDAQIKNFRLSRLYCTSPVSDVPQADYFNAVCRFHTSLALPDLWSRLSNLEKVLGKKEKAKNAPRLIDLDLLFYGPLVAWTREWILPHPKWHERLFVLAPLSDVTEEVPVEGGISIRELLQRFSNPHQEKIFVYQEDVEGVYAQSSN